MFRYERAKNVERRTRPRPSSIRPENNDQEMPQKHDRDIFFPNGSVGTVYKNPLFAPAALGGREIGRRKDPAMDFLPVRLHPPPRPFLIIRRKRREPIPIEQEGRKEAAEREGGENNNFFSSLLFLHYRHSLVDPLLWLVRQAKQGFFPSPSSAPRARIDGPPDRIDIIVRVFEAAAFRRRSRINSLTSSVFVEKKAFSRWRRLNRRKGGKQRRCF